MKINKQRGFVFLYRRNGAVITISIIILLSVWVFMMILVPQIAIVDYSLRPYLPPSRMGGPEDVYTLEHYRHFLRGAPGNPDPWNIIDMRIFRRTLIAAVFVTIFTLLIAYPLSWYLAHLASPAARRVIAVAIVIPYWINDILRAYSFRILFGSSGVINSTLLNLGIIELPLDFIRTEIALYAGLTYAYLLLMIFPIYNTLESQEKSQIEAARDFGASWIHIHRRIILPFARPGIVSGATMVFMLSAGALAVPQVLGGPSSLWFTELIYQNFFESLNWSRGAAYSVILLIASSAIILFFVWLLRVRIGDVLR